jgi:hypothetical protein
LCCAPTAYKTTAIIITEEEEEEEEEEDSGNEGKLSLSFSLSLSLFVWFVCVVSKLCVLLPLFRVFFAVEKP